VTLTQGSRCAATLGYGRFPLQGMALADGDVRSSCGNFRLDEHGVFDPGGWAARGAVFVRSRSSGADTEVRPPAGLELGPCEGCFRWGAHGGISDAGLCPAHRNDPLPIPTQWSGHRAPPARRPWRGCNHERGLPVFGGLPSGPSHASRTTSVRTGAGARSLRSRTTWVGGEDWSLGAASHVRLGVHHVSQHGVECLLDLVVVGVIAGVDAAD